MTSLTGSPEFSPKKDYSPLLHSSNSSLTSAFLLKDGTLPLSPLTGSSLSAPANAPMEVDSDPFSLSAPPDVTEAVAAQTDAMAKELVTSAGSSFAGASSEFQDQYEISPIPIAEGVNSKFFRVR